MDWLYPKRRGPEWKRGLTGQTSTSTSTSTRPLLLLAISGIAILLLSLSPYADYKSWLQYQSANSLQIFLIFLPVLLFILFMASYAANWLLHFRLLNPRQGSVWRAGSAGSSTWVIAIFVILIMLLMFLYYQSY